MKIKSKYVSYLKICFKNIKSEEFRRRVQALSQNELLVAERLGTLNDDKMIYLIQRDNTGGLLAYWSETVSKLIIADKLGFVPVIKWGKTAPFSENYLVNGKYNPFEYYFQQPCGIGVEEAEKSRFVLYSTKMDGEKYRYHYFEPEKKIEDYAAANKKYIKLQGELEKIFYEEIQQLFADNEVIGVQIRGADFRIGLKGHPAVIDVSDYIEETRRIIEGNSKLKIFLATDDKIAVKRYKEIFKEKVLFFTGNIRTDGTTGVHLMKGTEKNYHYHVGREVLRDVLALAKCDYFIGGLSNVSFAAQVFARSMGNEYKKCVILDNGHHYEDLNADEAMKYRKKIKYNLKKRR